MKATTMRATLISAVLVVLLLFVAVGDVKAATPYTTITMDFGWAIADSLFPRYIYATVLGHRTAIANGTHNDISELTATVIPYPNVSAATGSLKVVSSSANDKTASTGALDVEIYGLDANWNEQSEHITMNGTDTVAVVGEYRRINNMYVYDVGTAGVAVGNIVLTNGAGDTTYSKILATNDRAYQAHYTIPSGQKGFVTGWSTGTEGTKAALFRLSAKVDVGDRSRLSLFHTEAIMISRNSSYYHEFRIPLELPDRCDVKVTGEGLGGAVEGTAAIYLFHKK